LVFALETDNFLDLLTVGKQDKGGNPSNAVSSSELLVCIDINFRDGSTRVGG
jgi:hypothetical protein